MPNLIHCNTEKYWWCILCLCRRQKKINKIFASSVLSAGWLIAWLNQADSIWLQNWGFVTVKKKSCYSALQLKKKNKKKKSHGVRQKYLPPWRQSNVQRGQMSVLLSLSVTCYIQKFRRVRASQCRELHLHASWWRQRQYSLGNKDLLLVNIYIYICI